MFKNFLPLIFGLLILSCDKYEQEQMLTNGTWILDNGIITTWTESARFNRDQTYIIQNRITVRGADEYFVTGTLSGEWSWQDDNILFVNSEVNLPDDASAITILPVETGVSQGAFYGYVVSHVYQNDSSLVDSAGIIHFNDINEATIFPAGSPDPTTWTIITLTADTLEVDSKGEILRYYKE